MRTRYGPKPPSVTGAGLPSRGWRRGTQMTRSGRRFSATSTTETLTPEQVREEGLGRQDQRCQETAEGPARSDPATSPIQSDVPDRSRLGESGGSGKDSHSPHWIAQPIRDFLVHRFRSVMLVTFDARVFPSLLTKSDHRNNNLRGRVKRPTHLLVVAATHPPSMSWGYDRKSAFRAK